MRNCYWLCWLLIRLAVFDYKFLVFCFLFLFIIVLFPLCKRLFNCILLFLFLLLPLFLLLMILFVSIDILIARYLFFLFHS